MDIRCNRANLVPGKEYYKIRNGEKIFVGTFVRSMRSGSGDGRADRGCRRAGYLPTQKGPRKNGLEDPGCHHQWQWRREADGHPELPIADHHHERDQSGQRDWCCRKYSQNVRADVCALPIARNMADQSGY